MVASIHNFRLTTLYLKVSNPRSLGFGGLPVPHIFGGQEAFELFASGVETEEERKRRWYNYKYLRFDRSSCYLIEHSFQRKANTL